MPINIPPLDDRNYTDILQDAIARIPVHNPEWTNFNDSDPGVTLIQLFAFMTESILYRANQIPERNRLKFLQLLGIPLVPAAAAQGFVTVSNDRGPLDSRSFPAGLDVRAGQVRFRTTQGLTVLPITAQLFYKQAIDPSDEQDTLYRQLYADLLGDSRVPAFYETVPMPPPRPDGTLPVLDLATDTVDGCLWIALLSRPGETPEAARAQLADETPKTLTLGIMPHLDETGVTLAQGEITRAAGEHAPVQWEIADATNPTPNYRPLVSRSRGAFLNAPGLVEIDLPGTEVQLTSWNFAALEPGLEGTDEYPPSLADTNLSDRLMTWIRLRLDTTSETATTTSLKARLSWVGINATQVQQRVIVTGEVVGTGTGEPDQVFQLAHAPVLPDTLDLTVGGTLWQPIDDLLAADPEVPVSDPRLPIYQSEITHEVSAELRSEVFALDPESGQITFGDGTHGARPRQLIVASYAYGGGRQGNVGVNAITRSPELPAGFKVTNPLRTWGGDDAQDTTAAEKGVSRYVQHRDRLVSITDFADVTHQTPGIDLGRVAILPLFDPSLFDPDNPVLTDIPGAVTVMVIPASPNNTNPQPDQFFLEAVCNHLQPRRLVTTELFVRGPHYVDVWISVGITLLGGYAAGPVREAVKEELYRFLSPLYGGQQGTGWPLNGPVLQGELEAIVTRVDGVRLLDETAPLYLGTTTTDNVTRVTLAGLMLPRLAGVSVVSGPAVRLDQLRNAPAVSTGAEWTPIPILPERC
ncbi:MAG: hypothetical protein AAF215_22750 [Cyanobacteria bacterium P01_A01_bin.123]